MKCAQCGRAFSGHTYPVSRGGTRSYRHVPTRGAVRGDRCPSENKYVPAAPLEAAAWALIDRVIADRALERLVDAELRLRADTAYEAERREDTQRLRKDVVQQETALRNASRELVQASEEDVALQAELRGLAREISARLGALRQRLSDLDGELDAIERARSRPTRAVFLDEVRRALERANAEGRRRALELILDRALVNIPASEIEFEVRTETAAGDGRVTGWAA